MRKLRPYEFKPAFITPEMSLAEQKEVIAFNARLTSAAKPALKKLRRKRAKAKKQAWQSDYKASPKPRRGKTLAKGLDEFLSRNPDFQVTQPIQVPDKKQQSN